MSSPIWRTRIIVLVCIYMQHIYMHHTYAIVAVKDSIATYMHTGANAPWLNLSWASRFWLVQSWSIPNAQWQTKKRTLTDFRLVSFFFVSRCSWCSVICNVPAQWKFPLRWVYFSCRFRRRLWWRCRWTPQALSHRVGKGTFPSFIWQCGSILATC